MTSLLVSDSVSFFLHFVVVFFLPADAADEAVAVERPAQRRHHLSGDVLLTAVTLGPVEALVVLGADVLSTVVEETRVDQVTTAH